MSVEIKGIDYLDQNDYEKIIIIENTNNYVIDVIGPEDETKKIKSINKWSNALNGKSDEEIINSIIEYYLDYSIINQINDHEVIPNYNFLFNCIRGTRQLYLNLSNKKIEEVKSKIRMKYYIDREKMIEKNKDIKNYCLNISRGMCYKKEGGNNLTDSITINLLGCINQKNGTKDITQDEKIFLQDFLYSKFSGKDCFINIEDKNLYFEECEKYINLGYFITCDDLCISINDRNLLPEIVSVVDKHNKQIENAKKLQLKLEGF